MAEEGTRKGLRFAGYASVFDHLDRGGDIVRPGAFRRSLVKNPCVPLLWQHQPSRVIGSLEHLREDGRGLQVIGRLHDDDFGRLLKQQMTRGLLSGLSFGYRVQAARRDRGRREIDELELLEVSLVRHPMQPLAQVHKLAV
jgi:HK97 family phage prohead protease